MAKRGRICPLYDQQATNQQKANGCACQAPICGPASDCMGSLTRGCTVPAFVWRKLVLDAQAIERKRQS